MENILHKILSIASAELDQQDLLRKCNFQFDFC